MQDLLAKPLLVVTGKGGVGKSTVAAALGVTAASRGLRTIVAEVAARDDVSRALGHGSPRRFVEHAMDDGLHHISIDPESALEEYLRDQLPQAAAGLLAGSRAFSYLTAATPGLRELLTVGKVWELTQPDRRTPGARPYDLVILDAPATGHGLAILNAPATFADVARVGPISRQGRTIHEMLSDPQRTGVIAVATAEEMPVNEVLDLRDALRDGLGQPLAGIVVNAVLPVRFTAGDVAALDRAPSSRGVRAARAQAGRTRGQRAQVARLRRRCPGTDVRSLPFIFDSDMSPEALRRLGRDLVPLRDTASSLREHRGGSKP